MSKFYFSYEPDDSVKPYAHEFSYSEEFEEGYEHISEFHRFCRRIAKLYGYSNNAIDKCFGEEQINPYLD